MIFRNKKSGNNSRFSREAYLVVFLLLIIAQQLWLGILINKSFEENIILKLEGGHKQRQSPNESKSPPPPSPYDRYAVGKEQNYLIVRHVQSGQGTGNVMSGLLAAHLLGREFDRKVCVATEYAAFHQAFDSVDHHCEAILLESIVAEHPPTRNNTITLNNYQPPPNDCWLQRRLASDDSVLYYVGNTYPKWPSIPNDMTFSSYYQPKPSLLDMVPWGSQQQHQYQEPPSIVVHLRLEDGILDARAGLDNITLHTLGRVLLQNNHSTFLVTNNVAWYQFFEDNYGWSHPRWSVVQHSALGGIQWGSAQQSNPQYDTSFSPSVKNLQTMQMWADWYTLLQARRVYHTHSDFSLSAIHWNHRTVLGYTIQGVYYEDDEGDHPESSTVSGVPKLLLQEDYVKEMPVPRLIDRYTGDVASSNCEIFSTKTNGEPDTSAETMARRMKLALAMANRRRVEYQGELSETSKALLLAKQQQQQREEGNLTELPNNERMRRSSSTSSENHAETKGDYRIAKLWELRQSHADSQSRERQSKTPG